MQHILCFMPASLHTLYTFSFSHFRIHIPLFDFPVFKCNILAI